MIAMCHFFQVEIILDLQWDLFWNLSDDLNFFMLQIRIIKPCYINLQESIQINTTEL